MNAQNSVDTFLSEGQAFAARHRDELDADTGQMGGFAWGLLRAVAECPDCPGQFRVALEPAWTMLVGPAYHGIWTRAHAEQKPSKRGKKVAA